jgi:hypothetical protein
VATVYTVYRSVQYRFTAYRELYTVQSVFFCLGCEQAGDDNLVRSNVLLSAGGGGHLVLVHPLLQEPAAIQGPGEI